MSPGESVRFELAELSAVNYRRHRAWRFAFAAAGWAAFAALLALGVYGIFEAVPYLLLWGRLFLAGCLVLAGFLCVSLASIPFRLWARPPVSLELRPQGILFSFSRGPPIEVTWEERPLQMELLQRDNGPESQSGASYRLWVSRGARGYRLPWRRMVPLTYLTRSAFEQVLAAAKSASSEIKRIDNSRSPVLVRSGSRTSFLISRNGGGVA